MKTKTINLDEHEAMAAEKDDKLHTPLVCEWEFDEFSGAYFFNCGGENRGFTFMNSLKQDGFKFCPYCGKTLVVVCGL